MVRCQFFANDLDASSLFSDWTGLDEDEDTHVWEDNWDDDNVEDDFSNQLRYFNTNLSLQGTSGLNIIVYFTPPREVGCVLTNNCCV